MLGGLDYHSIAVAVRRVFAAFPWTAKGDLLVGTALGAYDVKSVGANGLRLMADSTQTDGTKWGTVNDLTADASPDGTVDFVETFDASAAGPKKVLLNNLPLGQVATQAQQESAASTSVAVTPLRQQFHPSASKGWAQFNGLTAGTNAPAAGYNVTSVTRTGTGAYTVNWTVAFSSANYATSFSSNATNGAGNPLFQITAIAAGSLSFTVLRRGDGVADDASVISVIAFGDL